MGGKNKTNMLFVPLLQERVDREELWSVDCMGLGLEGAGGRS